MLETNEVRISRKIILFSLLFFLVSLIEKTRRASSRSISFICDYPDIIKFPERFSRGFFSPYMFHLNFLLLILRSAFLLDEQEKLWKTFIEWKVRHIFQSVVANFAPSWIYITVEKSCLPFCLLLQIERCAMRKNISH